MKPFCSALIGLLCLTTAAHAEMGHPQKPGEGGEYLLKKTSGSYRVYLSSIYYQADIHQEYYDIIFLGSAGNESLLDGCMGMTARECREKLLSTGHLAEAQLFYASVNLDHLNADFLSYSALNEQLCDTIGNAVEEAIKNQHLANGNTLNYRQNDIKLSARLAIDIDATTEFWTNGQNTHIDRIHKGKGTKELCDLSFLKTIQQHVKPLAPH